MVTAVVNSWGPLAKQRPSQMAFLVSALASWSPRALTSLSAATVRSVEKSVRILMIHLSRQVQCFPLSRRAADAQQKSTRSAVYTST